MWQEHYYRNEQKGVSASLLPAFFFYHRLLRSPWELSKLNKALTIGFYTLKAAKLSEGMIWLCSSTNISEAMWQSESLEPGFPPQTEWPFSAGALQGKAWHIELIQAIPNSINPSVSYDHESAVPYSVLFQSRSAGGWENNWVLQNPLEICSILTSVIEQKIQI